MLRVGAPEFHAVRDVPRIWWSHLAGQMMLQTLKEASLSRSYVPEFDSAAQFAA